MNYFELATDLMFTHASILLGGAEVEVCDRNGEHLDGEEIETLIAAEKPEVGNV